MGRATISKHLYICVARISIHALRGEGDFNFRPVPPFGTWKFQSTPSVGRATSLTSVFLIRSIFQSTPSVGRATASIKENDIPCFISIHALRGEGDHTPGRVHSHSTAFQSTPSVGRATLTVCDFSFTQSDFNPRPPWGGRRGNNFPFSSFGAFQSTPSVGRATRKDIEYAIETLNISIHALRVEGDALSLFAANKSAHFNPRPPWGGRL